MKVGRRDRCTEKSLTYQISGVKNGGIGRRKLLDNCRENRGTAPARGKSREFSLVAILARFVRRLFPPNRFVYFFSTLTASQKARSRFVSGSRVSRQMP